MLSAFTARPVVELKSRDKSKIESVLSHGDRVFVGLSTGSLRIYRVKETDNKDSDDSVGNGDASDSKPRDVELLREEEKFSRRAVQQLAIIKEAGILIALSDSYVSLYDLDTYLLSERLEKTRGSTCFVTTRSIEREADSGIASIVSRLAVAVKRKILLWTWQDFELTGPPDELTLPATVKSLTWASSIKLVAGMDLGFSMVDLKAQTVSEINRSTHAGEAGGPSGTRFGAVNSSGMGYMGMGSWVPKPIAATLGDQELLLVKDINSLFIDADGQAKEKRQVPWTAAPDAIGFSYPYLLALLPPARGVLELRNPDTLSLLQSIPVPNASILHVPQPNISLAHAGKGFLVASDRSIWRMDAVGYGIQMDQLMAGARYDEALSLVALIEDTLLLDKHQRVRSLKTEKARYLFNARDFRQAMELFSEAPARPDQVIALYPAAIAGNTSGIESEARSSTPEPPTESKQSDPPPISKQKTPVATPSKRHSSKMSETLSTRATNESDTHRSDTSDQVLEGRDLNVAINELRAFLAQTRVQLQRYIDFDGQLKQVLPGGHTTEAGAFVEPDFAHFIDYDSSDSQETMGQKLLDAATLVDTTLFRAYMLVSPSLAGSLFRLDNFCSAGVVEEKLYANGRYNELVDFLWGKKLHGEALALLQKLGKDTPQEDTTDDFRGPDRTIRYLQQLPFEQIDLILQYANWPLEADPRSGLQIFVADTENAETLPRDKVVAYLEGFGSSLVVLYLEHIIMELDDPTTSFHDKLIRLYICSVRDGGQSSPDDGVSTKQQKLEAFLRSSKSLDKNAILKELPTEDSHFYESRAIILSKLSFHKEALRIYVYQMQDHRKAEEYCNQVHLALTSTTSTTLDPDDPHIGRAQCIYTTLLALYLSPPHPHKQNLVQALEVLSLHGSRLPALNTLSALPLSLPIKDLESYFRARMRSATSIARENAIMASLSNVEKVTAESDLLLGDDYRTGVSKTTTASGRNRRVLLGENKLCNICNKRFGRAAARVFPSAKYCTMAACLTSDLDLAEFAANIVITTGVRWWLPVDRHETTNKKAQAFSADRGEEFVPPF